MALRTDNTKQVFLSSSWLEFLPPGQKRGNRCVSDSLAWVIESELWVAGRKPKGF